MLRQPGGSLTDNKRGFTIVELLVVIVVIAILAAITIVAYSGITAKAQQSKIKQDIATMKTAVSAAQISTGQTLYQIMLAAGIPPATAGFTSYNCTTKATGTNLATLPKTDACWTDYYTAMDALSAASTTSGLRNLLDPWGRPYYLDENEGVDVTNPSNTCLQDVIATFPQPFVNGAAAQNYTNLPNSGNSGCTTNTAFQSVTSMFFAYL